MTIFIILVFVILFFALVNQNKKNSKKVVLKTSRSRTDRPKAIVKHVEKVQKETQITTSFDKSIKTSIPTIKPVINVEPVSKIQKEEQITIRYSSPVKASVSMEENITKTDDSIIDVSNIVTSLLGNIKVTSENRSANISAPYWPHRYVYSYSDLNTANAEQRKFYNVFKTEFLKGNFLFLNGNANYSFILMFDLLNEFAVHKDFQKIEEQLEDLGNNYPITKSYCVSFLIQRLDDYNMNDEAQEYREKNNVYDYDYWKLGKRYKKILDLSNEQENTLNKIWFQNNVFTEIEFCKLEVLKQFLRATEHLQQNFTSVDNSLDNLIDELTDLIVRKYYRYRKGSQNYKYSFETVQGQIYGHILKLSENNVRESYSNKRKLTAEFNYSNPEIYNVYFEKVITKLDVFFPEDQKQITTPDLETEKRLNESNTTRWKTKYDKIVAQYSDSENLEQQIIQLAEENIKNPSVENIFYEASKFVAKINKVTALRLYIYYIDKDLSSAKFDNKQMNKTIQKSLFKTNEQLNDFEQILSDFITNKNLDTTLEKINSIYLPKRKKIFIDKDTIEEVKKQHSGTVDLLNEYLQDEYEDDNIVIVSEEIANKDEVQINIIHKNVEHLHSKYLNEISLTSVQKDVLGVFEKNSFNISQSDLEEYLKDQNLLMSSTVDAINEICFDVLDDVLIEEDNDYFTINTDYYKKLLNND
ncbi:tellurite resistance TerB C-terminal domain-containing protein [Chryseobacterium gregarium]|uniref:tellurite resistance TerB C-terminal domain-containing protein n=1 Tax=Chryseobacterium gregarium TaxID=456299 RepID=UPI0003F706C3|nr:tellurite resistance TerB C-terminal domain-containing protein [Chryseobacterium gregarium]